MFKFTKWHLYDEDPAVVQVLVFSHDRVFYDNGGDRTELLGKVALVSMNAIYALRAVMDINGDWTPVIRCGKTGFLLWEGKPVPLSLEAIRHAKERLFVLITGSFFDQGITI